MNFLKNGFANRIAKAVEPSLEPGETVVVSLWTRDPGGDASRAILGTIGDARTESFVLTLTDRRVVVHQGNNFDARKSTFLGSYPRAEVSVLNADPPGKPRHLNLRFGTEKDAGFSVQSPWRDEARQFAEGLAAAP